MPLEPHNPSRQAPEADSALEGLAESRPSHCLNCGTVVTGKFCEECGQVNKVHRVSLRPLLADLMVEVVSWDSRLLRTLRSLLIRPGFLTNEYNTGRLAPYLSPLKLYLTVSVLFFLLMAWKNPLNKVVVIQTNGVSVGSTAAPAPSRTKTASQANGFFEREMAPRLMKAQKSKFGCDRGYHSGRLSPHRPACRLPTELDKNADKVCIGEFRLYLLILPLLCGNDACGALAALRGAPGGKEKALCLHWLFSSHASVKAYRRHPNRLKPRHNCGHPLPWALKR